MHYLIVYLCKICLHYYQVCYYFAFSNLSIVCTTFFVKLLFFISMILLITILFHLCFIIFQRNCLHSLDTYFFIDFCCQHIDLAYR